MRQFIESRKVEYSFIFLFVIAVALNSIFFPSWRVNLAAILLVVLYFSKIVLALADFRHSKGIAMINTLLYIEILTCVMAIDFFFLKDASTSYAYLQIMSNVNLGAIFFSLIIGIFILLRLNKISKMIYWNRIKNNFILAVVGVIVSNIAPFIFDA